MTESELDELEATAKAALPSSWAEHQKWRDEAGYNNAGSPTRFFYIPEHNGNKTVEMTEPVSLHIVAFQPEAALRLIAAARASQEALAKAWDDGLDFTGAALRAGCSLDEAANGNPFRKRSPV